MSTNPANIQSYLNLITSQHAAQPNYTAMLKIWLGYCNDVYNLLTAINNAYNINNAVGVQLDIIGQRIGTSRTVVLSGVTTVLSDADFQVLLKAQIFQNNWNGITQSIYTDWSNLFPLNPLIVKDNQNMTMDVIEIGLNSGNQPALVRNGYIIPQPQGVTLNTESAVLPAFGFGVDNSNISGFGVGTWISIA